MQGEERSARAQGRSDMGERAGNGRFREQGGGAKQGGGLPLPLLLISVSCSALEHTS